MDQACWELIPVHQGAESPLILAQEGLILTQCLILTPWCSDQAVIDTSTACLT